MGSNDIIYDLAEEFSKLKNYNYELVLGTKDGKPKMTFIVDMSSLSQRFTHISGLEHIDDIKDFNMNNLSANQKVNKRNQTFKKIMSKNITFQTIKKKSGIFFDNLTGEYFNFEKTHNPTTGKPYTIIERINSQKNIESVFNSLYKGKVLQRNTLDNLIGYSKINAPYVLKFPTSSNMQSLYIFFEKSSSTKVRHSKDDYMRVNTAFLDKNDLIRNPINTFTVLKINKIKVSNKSQNAVQTIYENQKYTEYLQTKNIASNNTEYMKIDFGNKGLINSGDVAVLSRPRFTFGQAISSFLKGIVNKVKKIVERLLRKPDQDTTGTDGTNRGSGNSLRDSAPKQADTTSLKSETHELLEKDAPTMEQSQKPLVKTAAAPRKSFSQGLDELAKRPRAQGSPKPPVQNIANKKHHKD